MAFNNLFLKKKWFLLRPNIKLIMQSFWPLLRLLRPGPTIQKALSIRFLSVPIIITFNSLWIRRVWALDRFIGSKSYYAIIFKSIIIKIRPIELQILCLASCKEALIKKKSFKLKTCKFLSSAVFLYKGQPFKP